jgi:hypothetical protein
MREVSLDPSPPRWAAICRSRKELSLLRENVLPHGHMRGIDDAIATIQAARGLVESLPAAASIRSQAPAVSCGANVYEVGSVLSELLARDDRLEAVLRLECFYTRCGAADNRGGLPVKTAN